MRTFFLIKNTSFYKKKKPLLFIKNSMLQIVIYKKINFWEEYTPLESDALCLSITCCDSDIARWTTWQSERRSSTKSIVVQNKCQDPWSRGFRNMSLLWDVFQAQDTRLVTSISALWNRRRGTVVQNIAFFVLAILSGAREEVLMGQAACLSGLPWTGRGSQSGCWEGVSFDSYVTFSAQ